MKKLILLALVSQVAVAQPIYCPERIECGHENNLASCVFESPEKNDWHKIRGHQNLAGDYLNVFVSAPYYSYDLGYALCVYQHTQTYSTLTLHARPESNIEMLYDAQSNWRREESWWECTPSHDTDCPLQVQAAVMIRNTTGDDLYLSNDKVIPRQHFMRVYQTDFTDGMLEMYAENDFIGRIEVDVDNRLKLNKIISNDGAPYKIIQNDHYNALEIVSQNDGSN